MLTVSFSNAGSPGVQLAWCYTVVCTAQDFAKAGCGGAGMMFTFHLEAVADTAALSSNTPHQAVVDMAEQVRAAGMKVGARVSFTISQPEHTQCPGHACRVWAWQKTHTLSCSPASHAGFCFNHGPYMPWPAGQSGAILTQHLFVHHASSYFAAPAPLPQKCCTPASVVACSSQPWLCRPVVLL